MDAMSFVKSSALETKVMELVASSSSSGVYFVVLLDWLIRTVVFVLWIGVSLLRFSFLVIRECTRRYFGVALLELTENTITDLQAETVKENTITDLHAETVKEEEEAEAEESPLSPIVARDRVQICEENLGVEDRERLLFEFERIVAPQVSAFQLGEIVVPIDDTRQLVMFLKRKLSEASSEDINAAVCGAVLNINREPDQRTVASACVEAWERNKLRAVVYVAARLHGDGNVHLVLVGHKVEDFLGSSEFRNRFNPPRTRRDKKEWQTWTLTHLRALRESAVRTAEELLARRPVYAQMW